MYVLLRVGVDKVGVVGVEKDFREAKRKLAEDIIRAHEGESKRVLKEIKRKVEGWMEDNSRIFYTSVVPNRIVYFAVVEVEV